MLAHTRADWLHLLLDGIPVLVCDHCCSVWHCGQGRRTASSCGGLDQMRPVDLLLSRPSRCLSAQTAATNARRLKAYLVGVTSLPVA